MFYLTQVIKTNEGVVKALYDYASYDEAVQVFHQTIASAMANAEVSHISLMIFNEANTVLKQECWDKPVKSEII